jgi:hypothetical protein
VNGVSIVGWRAICGRHPLSVILVNSVADAPAEANTRRAASLPSLPSRPEKRSSKRGRDDAFTSHSSPPRHIVPNPTGGRLMEGQLFPTSPAGLGLREIYPPMCDKSAGGGAAGGGAGGDGGGVAVPAAVIVAAAGAAAAGAVAAVGGGAAVAAIGADAGVGAGAATVTGAGGGGAAVAAAAATADDAVAVGGGAGDTRPSGDIDNTTSKQLNPPPAIHAVAHLGGVPREAGHNAAAVAAAAAVFEAYGASERPRLFGLGESVVVVPPGGLTVADRLFESETDMTRFFRGLPDWCMVVSSSSALSAGYIQTETDSMSVRHYGISAYDDSVPNTHRKATMLFTCATYGRNSNLMISVPSPPLDPGNDALYSEDGPTGKYEDILFALPTWRKSGLTLKVAILLRIFVPLATRWLVTRLLVPFLPRGGFSYACFSFIL